MSKKNSAIPVWWDFDTKSRVVAPETSSEHKFNKRYSWEGYVSKSTAYKLKLIKDVEKIEKAEINQV